MFSQRDLTHLPSNNQQIRSLDGKDYSPADNRKIEFFLPSQLGFANMKNSFLSFDFEITNQLIQNGGSTVAHLRPSEAYGLLGMFRMCRVP